MKILGLVIICTTISQAKGGEDAPLPEGSDSWIFCHGMSMNVFKAACACMLKLKKHKADKYGLNNSVVDHWPVVGDRIYSRDDCRKEMQYINNTETGKGRKRRKFYNERQHLWDPMPIRYTFHKDVTIEDKKMIVGAMQHWENDTCLSFEEFDRNIHDEKLQRLYFTNDPSGCYSFIGMQSTQTPGHAFPQQINLQSIGCTTWIGVPIHEIGHALGLFHEQNRLDRDFWVTFYAKNVEAGVISNFDHEPQAHDFGVPYDYGSVMQYDNRAFSNRGGIVLEATLPYSQYTMGQRGRASYMDVKIMNRAYCYDSCKDAPQLACQHQGYMDPKDCSKCRCPEGFGGTLCETAGDSDPGCTPNIPILEATNQIQCLKSPGYDDVGYYERGVGCNWIIQAPPGERIRARFDGPFGIYCSGSNTRGPMCFHWVEVKFKADKEIRGGRFCCYDNNANFVWNDPGVITSDDNVLVVHFDGSWPSYTNAYTSVPPEMARRGFKLCFALDHPTGALANATDTGSEDWWNPSSPEGVEYYTSAAPTTTTTTVRTILRDKGDVMNEAHKCPFDCSLAYAIAFTVTVAISL